VPQTVTYKGHQIRAHAILVDASDDGEWAAQAVVRIPLPTGGREQPLRDPDDRIFPSQEDAEGYAVHLAMRWVDRHGQ
jgi:hypothetical protein